MAFSPLDGGCGGREMAVEDFEMFTGSFWGGKYYAEAWKNAAA